jgi:hypothetical protein
VIRFAKGGRKLERMKVMRPHLDRLNWVGRTGVVAIESSQEFQWVYTGATYHANEDSGEVARFGYEGTCR